MSSSKNQKEVLRSAFPDIHEDERPYTMVSYGLPFEQACRKHVDGFLNVQKVYIIASKSLAQQTNNLKKLEDALGPKHAGSWLGIPAHTPYESLIPIINDMRAKKVDCLVTLGGGSLADGAKTIIYALENGVSSLDDLIELGEKFRTVTPEAMAGIGNAPKVKLVFLPTTLSGAEYSRYGGCTKPVSKLKIMFTHPGMFASLIVLDGELCRTTPDWVWRSTGVRAIDHCVENICSTNARLESDAACERALPELVNSLLAYDQDPDNLDARLQSQLGTNASMTGLTLGVMCGASHGIGHQLGPLGVGHGHTSCVLLPGVMKVNAPYNQPQQEKVLRALWGDANIASVLRKGGCTDGLSDAGDALRAVFDELGMPRSLQDVGVARDQWESIEVNSLEDKMVKLNPKPMITREDVREVLELVAGN